MGVYCQQVLEDPNQKPSGRSSRSLSADRSDADKPLQKLDTSVVDPWDSAFSRMLDAQSALKSRLTIVSEDTPRTAEYELRESLQRVLPAGYDELKLHPIGLDESGRALFAIELTKGAGWLLPNPELVKRGPNIEPDEPSAPREPGARRKLRVATMVQSGREGFSDYEVVNARVRFILRPTETLGESNEMIILGDGADVAALMRENFSSGAGVSVVQVLLNDRVADSIKRHVGLELIGPPDYISRDIDAKTGAISVQIALPSKEIDGATHRIELGPYAFGPDEAGLLQLTGNGWRNLGPIA